MFDKKSDESEGLDLTIKSLEDEMLTRDGDSEDYATMLNRLERLYKLKEKHSSRRVSPDTLILVGGNILGIIIIVGYEHSHVIATKALGFAGKLR